MPADFCGDSQRTARWPDDDRRRRAAGHPAVAGGRLAANSVSADGVHAVTRAFPAGGHTHSCTGTHRQAEVIRFLLDVQAGLRPDEPTRWKSPAWMAAMGQTEPSKAGLAMSGPRPTADLSCQGRGGRTVPATSISAHPSQPVATCARLSAQVRACACADAKHAQPAKGDDLLHQALARSCRSYWRAASGVCSALRRPASKCSVGAVPL
jgi:hypothetical protein